MKCPCFPVFLQAARKQVQQKVASESALSSNKSVPDHTKHGQHSMLTRDYEAVPPPAALTQPPGRKVAPAHPPLSQPPSGSDNAGSTVHASSSHALETQLAEAQRKLYEAIRLQAGHGGFTTPGSAASPEPTMVQHQIGSMPWPPPAIPGGIFPHFPGPAVISLRPVSNSLGSIANSFPGPLPSAPFSPFLAPHGSLPLSSDSQTASMLSISDSHVIPGAGNIGVGSRFPVSKTSTLPSSTPYPSPSSDTTSNNSNAAKMEAAMNFLNANFGHLR
jgi:hypothetical protein